jgi:hypothetical protein
MLCDTEAAEGEVEQIEAADMLSLSTRQIRGIVEKVQGEGDGGLATRRM